ncbi:hypothetical protein HPP92_022021 [Vanilla planifolia]|uniref:Mei2-like C-terminal RNA recognition motif domain-containing protein n=1 Tax=Vanilla planifolia TaxID=51239 RepID=A0A835PTZ7_VANPL|nr:hypothetical protein HPP92_022344 [Vanilla planifolia]KAG0458893.1 hypothetical protein HPP92_022021 [Vanilla planifolia]
MSILNPHAPVFWPTAATCFSPIPPPPLPSFPYSHFFSETPVGDYNLNYNLETFVILFCNPSSPYTQVPPQPPALYPYYASSKVAPLQTTVSLPRHVVEVSKSKNELDNDAEKQPEAAEHGVRMVTASRWVARGPRGPSGRQKLGQLTPRRHRRYWVPKDSINLGKRCPSVGRKGEAFEFREMEEAEEAVGTTTVMIKNIPNKLSKQQLLDLLDDHCFTVNEKIHDEPSSEYDFVYLPMDFVSGNNLGYAFVNFTCSVAATRFYREKHLKPWNSFGSRKGSERLLSHFENSIFACPSSEYLPVFFEPTRDGFRRPNGNLVGKLVEG